MTASKRSEADSLNTDREVM